MDFRGEVPREIEFRWGFALRFFPVFHSKMPPAIRAAFSRVDLTKPFSFSGASFKAKSCSSECTLPRYLPPDAFADASRSRRPFSTAIPA